ncbi:MAG: hypothetical protein RI986_130, partial [Planctomycetota bacterium]
MSETPPNLRLATDSGRGPDAADVF